MFGKAFVLLELNKKSNRVNIVNRLPLEKVNIPLEQIQSLQD